MATTATKTKTTNAQQAQTPVSQGALAVIEPPRLPLLPEIMKEYDLTLPKWRTLIDVIFPSAIDVGSVLLALDYCKSRDLDPWKRVVHIVPIYNKQKKRMVPTVWPGIAELRTTAFRTGSYAGCDEAVFGPRKDKSWSLDYENEQRERVQREVTVKFPEWCQITVYRNVGKPEQRCKFVGPKVYWEETYATIGRTDCPNEMWQNRPEGQLEKCAEAAALRKAFPEELGNDLTLDEIGHARGEDVVTSGGPVIEHEPLPQEPQPATNVVTGEQSRPIDFENGDKGATQQTAPQNTGNALNQAPPEEPKSKAQVWLDGTVARIKGCPDDASLQYVTATYIDPYRAKMPAELAKAIDLAIENKRASWGVEDDTDTTGTVEEPPFEFA